MKIAKCKLKIAKGENSDRLMSAGKAGEFRSSTPRFLENGTKVGWVGGRKSNGGSEFRESEDENFVPAL
jgi:hypothetical protein